MGRGYTGQAKIDLEDMGVRNARTTYCAGTLESEAVLARLAGSSSIGDSVRRSDCQLPGHAATVAIIFSIKDTLLVATRIETPAPRASDGSKCDRR